MSWDYESYDAYPQYESVDAKRAKALLAAQKLAKKGRTLTPATVKGKKLASSFWGQSWNKNLERYQQYDNRLPRGRSYVRNGMVIHLEIEKGEIKALVSGSSLYEVRIQISPLAKDRWQTLRGQCAGQIGSLVSLLQGTIPPAIMELVTHEKHGLFPEPRDIRFICSCPDYADLCKHSSAALYGVGARLDENPGLLFLLRGVDHTELISDASEAIVTDTSAAGSDHSLGDLSDIFGIELDEVAVAPVNATPIKKAQAKKQPSKKASAPAALAKKASPTAGKGKKKSAAPSGAAKKQASRAAAKKRGKGD